MESKENRMDKFRKLLNKKFGQNIAYDLEKENPTEVKDWIPTGSRLLDSIICKGKRTGIPIGKICEIAGLPSTGKSYLAAQIAINADKKGYDIVYFDSESSLNPKFIERMGIDLKNFLYIQAVSVETVLKSIEELLAFDEVPKVFIWDSISMTACESDHESDFDPSSSIGMKPRILSKGFKKLTIPLANHGSTLLVLNQMYTNITSNRYEMIANPYKAHGGLALRHSYSLSIWLTEGKSKDSYIYNSSNRVIGSEVKAKIEKSRFGTMKRSCVFKILWGDEISVQDEESWFEVVKQTKFIKSAGPWFKILYSDGTEESFRSADWIKKLQEEKFRNRVEEILDDYLINEENNPREEEEKMKDEHETENDQQE